MGNNTIKMRLVVVIFILFVGTIIIPCKANNVVKNQSQTTLNGNVLYVGGAGPGNYTKIQDAVDNASDQDKIFVFSGLYMENVYINKSINLLGENRETTIIDANGSSSPIVIVISNVSIRSFTVQNSGGSSSAGIHITKSYLTESINIIINDNKIINNFNGIDLRYSSNTSIINNTIIQNKNYGIFFGDVDSSKIENNKITQNKQAGIWLDSSNQIKIIRNDIDRNKFNLVLGHSSYNDISENIISNGELGMGISISYGNRICFNNFINNTKDIVFEYGLHWALVGNRFLNNYWDAYFSIGPKIIIGSYMGFIHIIKPNIKISWSEFDWLPARRPHNIGV